MASSRSSKKLIPKYIKFIMLQKVSECKHFVNFLRGEVQHAIMNIDHLNGLIQMMEVMEFTWEIYDSVRGYQGQGRVFRDLGGSYVLSLRNGVGWLLGLCLLGRLSLDEDVELNGKIDLYISHKKQPLQRFYLKNMVRVKEDDGLRCYSSSLFTTRIKKRGGRTLIDSCDKRKEKVDEFLAATPTKEHQAVVINYKRAIVKGKAKMVEVVAPVQENVHVGIKQEERKRKNVLGLMAPANFVKNLVVSASMGQGSSVKVC
nr:hypothetical protein [Tanacetum cinerariifolium]